MSGQPPVLTEPVRINQIGQKRSFDFQPDDTVRAAIARWLGILELPRFEAGVDLMPGMEGWTLKGRVRAEAVQACGLTLEPVAETIDESFALDLVEAPEDSGPSEIDVDLDETAPDRITDGRIDVSRYVLEALSLALDPFPRKEGAVFEPPEETAEISPFAILKDRVKRDPPDVD